MKNNYRFQAYDLIQNYSTIEKVICIEIVTWEKKVILSKIKLSVEVNLSVTNKKVIKLNWKELEILLFRVF